MKNLKTRIAALLMIALLALTVVPTASAAVLDRPCPGAVGIADCIVDESYCIAWYVAFGTEPAGCKSTTTTTKNGVESAPAA